MPLSAYNLLFSSFPSEFSPAFLLAGCTFFPMWINPYNSPCTLHPDLPQVLPSTHVHKMCRLPPISAQIVVTRAPRKLINPLAPPYSPHPFPSSELLPAPSSTCRRTQFARLIRVVEKRMRRESIRLGLGIPKMSVFSSYVLSVPSYGAPKFPHLPSKSASKFLQGFAFHLVLLPQSPHTWCPVGATTVSCLDEPPSNDPQPPHLPLLPI